MRAVQIAQRGDVRVVELPEPKPEPGEVCIRVRWAAVCATDRKLAQHGVPEPRVAGHEMAGCLEDGTLVGVHPDLPCGRCRQCALGWGNRCPSKQAVGIQRDGGFAEWLVVPATHAVPVPDVAADLVPLLEPLACCVHAGALLNAGCRRRAVVVGGGAMGVLALWALQAAGVTVAVCSRGVERRRLARELGADAVIGPDMHPADALGGPVEAAVVTAPGAAPLQWAAEHVEVGGVLHVFAGTPGGATLDGNAVHYRHLQLVGSTGSRLADYLRARALVASGAIDLDRLPRTVIPLEALPEALMADPPGETLRTLVEIGGDAP